MIKLKKLTILGNDSPLLTEANMTLESGEKVVISGPSGCGKSTLLRAIAGFYPFTGEISIDNLTLSPTNISLIRQKLAYITQDSIMGASIVKDSLLLPYTFKANAGKAPDNQRINQVLDMVKLSPKILNSASENLSGGERQRVSIARCLLLNRSIFLADEITSALDAFVRDDIINLFKTLPCTMLAVAHDEVFIKAFPKRFYFNEQKLTGENIL